jgi:hypothetical protein
MFYMTTATSDEPGLVTIDDCLNELSRCLRWERHHQKDHDDWLEENPAGNARMLAIVRYWRERRIRLEERMQELNELLRT